MPILKISPYLPALTNSNLYHSLTHNHSYLTINTQINKNNTDTHINTHNITKTHTDTDTPLSLNINLSHSLYLILNSTLSLISILLIVNYCETFLTIVQYLSTKTHSLFLNLVIPYFPYLTNTNYYTNSPSFTYFISTIYLYLSYIGISAQLAFTIDLFYLYNLPTIYIYKILTKIYGELLKILTFLVKVYQYDQRNWLSC